MTPATEARDLIDDYGANEARDLAYTRWCDAIEANDDPVETILATGILAYIDGYLHGYSQL